MSLICVSPAFRLSALLAVATALTAAACLPASASSLSTCTQSYAAWTQVRDRALVRLEATPTLLGLDNTWCARSPSQVPELRARLNAVKTVCASVEEKDQPQVTDLIGRTESLLSRTRVCAPPPATVTQRGAWDTSVRPAPPSARKETTRKTLPPASPSVPSELSKRGPAVVVTAPAKITPVKVAVQDKSQTKAKPSGPVAVAASPSPPADRAPTAVISNTPALQPFSVAAGPVETTAFNAAPPGPAARPVAPPPSAGSPAQHQSSDPECLSVLMSSSTTFIVENTHCSSGIVLTSIELAGEDQTSRCFTKKIRSQISLASAASAPHINYQCIEGSPGCSIEVLRGMFPECYAG